jgi:small subunit ribosomal protein S1
VVSGTNKGGFDIRLGKVKAFCPFSQIDLYRPADPETLIGQVYRFRVTELKGSTVVVSRAALLREEREENAKELRTKLEVGARMTGTVRSIQKFGVFVDLGGIDGLVHLSELSWTRVDDPHECIELGQRVEVVITEIDEARDRIGLSLKRALADPFVETLEGLAQGAVLKGQVARLTNFGAFVTIAPGVDGMVHVSDMAHRRIRHPKEILSVGDQVEVKVTEIDIDRRRVGLSLKALADDPWEAATSGFKVGQTVKGTVVSLQDFGVFVEIQSGLTALLPASETGIPRGKSLASTFKVGKEIDVQVLRIDANERKMAVTTRDASEIGSSRPERRDGRGGAGRGPAGSRSSGPRNSGPRVWIDRDDGDEAPVGSLGAALMAALSKKDDE